MNIMAGTINTHTTSPHSVSTFQSPSTLRTLRNIAESDNLAQHPMTVAKLQAQCLRELMGQSASEFNIQTLYTIPKIRIYSIDDLPVAGTAMWSGNAWCIEVNAALNEDERRFTVLHELKHIIDNPHTTRLFAGGDLAESTHVQEMAADYFATCVLNPVGALTPSDNGEGRS